MSDVGKSTRLHFGAFWTDLTTGELFRHGTKIPLQGKPFQILALLLQHPKQLVTRQELIRTVWPDTFVEGDLCLNVAIRRLRSALEDDPSNPHFIETVGSHGYRFIASVHGSPAPGVRPANNDRPRVAIFPFKTVMGREHDFFGPGMTELLIAQLRRMDPPFDVVTPEFTTERAHKAKGTLSLCRDAAANYVLLGVISELEGRSRISVRLLNCAAQACLWADSYSTEDKDIFTAQEEITRSIASALVKTLSAPLHLSDRQLVSQSAHQNYVHGCGLLSKLTEQGLERCIPLFEAAVRECPSFALAWAALANAHCAMARLGLQPSRKAFPKVKACAERALEIEDIAEARTALAYYQFIYERDWNAAEMNLMRALAIDPHYPMAMGGYAQLLAALGRHEDAVFMMRRAQEVDPFSGYAGMMLGFALYFAGDYEAAVVELKSATELDSSTWVGHMSIGMALERLGKMEEALAEFRLAVEQSGHGAMARALLAYGLARSGDIAAAIEILNSLLRLRQRRYFSPYWLAAIYVALGQRAEAVQWLGTAGEERCSWIVFIREDPKFASLQHDKVLAHILDAVHLPTVATPANNLNLQLQD